jgi:catechol 2,3-dioxygenase-like lactoylglutathione lyase family enzyme
MPSAPIRRHVGQAVVPVRDLARSARWYGEVLGFEPDAASHDGTILDIPVQDGPGIALDATRPDFTPERTRRVSTR